MIFTEKYGYTIERFFKKDNKFLHRITYKNIMPYRNLSEQIIKDGFSVNYSKQENNLYFTKEFKNENENEEDILYVIKIIKHKEDF